ncbi:MAG: hypothetical protein GMKNLPBB_02370 [Myxococcota bacterium]|nr:hypothetical protein [Myxococcota bacterium]
MLIGVVFWFFLIRPENKRRQEHEKLLAGLKKGDAVVTESGILGKIVSISNAIAVLEVADKVKISVLRSKIAGLQSAEAVTKEMESQDSSGKKDAAEKSTDKDKKDEKAKSA